MQNGNNTFGCKVHAKKIELCGIMSRDLVFLFFTAVIELDTTRRKNERTTRLFCDSLSLFIKGIERLHVTHYYFPVQCRRKANSCDRYALCLYPGNESSQLLLPLSRPGRPCRWHVVIISFVCLNRCCSLWSKSSKGNQPPAQPLLPLFIQSWAVHDIPQTSRCRITFDVLYQGDGPLSCRDHPHGRFS